MGKFSKFLVAVKRHFLKSLIVVGVMACAVMVLLLPVIVCAGVADHLFEATRARGAGALVGLFISMSLLWAMVEAAADVY
jgi:TRAP-type C4-dicarboxylate transport system permease large subunit